MTEEHFNALPAGYELFEYEIRSVLGHGGFGITYLAWDKNLEKEVAIKEYLPAEFAVRQGKQTVRPRSTGDQEDYQWGLERFVKEAQTLALFRHQSIVPVFRFFEANGTAYMVMEYQKGEALSGLMRKHRGEFTEEDLLSLTMPLLEGLSAVHKAGYLHRDVKPGNIFIREDGSPVLLDFGAARDAVGRKSKNLTSIVTPGYAPLEQYFADGNQGPWTDIYALAAILYQAVTGKIPPEAPARVKNDPIKPCREQGQGKFSETFLGAIDRALSVEEEERPQSTDQWRDMLEGRISADAPDDQKAEPQEQGAATLFAGGRRPSAGGPTSLAAERSVPPEKKSKVGLLVGGSIAAALLLTGAGAGAWYLSDEQGFNTALGISGTADTADNSRGRSAAERDAERRRQEEANRKAAEAERKRQADLKRQQDEADRKARADAEARRQADLKRQQDEADRKAQAEAERKRQADLKRQQAEADRKAQAEADRKARAEADRKAKEDEKRLGEEADRKAQEDAEARRQAELKRQQEEADKKARAEAERKRQEELKRQQDETARKRREEADRKRREEAERKRRELASRPTVRCGSSLASLNSMYTNRTDCFFLSRVLNATLRGRQPGVTNRWRNSRTGTSGTFRVLRTIPSGDGSYCRRFRQTVTARGRTRQAFGTACLVNGRWRIRG